MRKTGICLFSLVCLLVYTHVGKVVPAYSESDKIVVSGSTILSNYYLHMDEGALSESAHECGEYLDPKTNTHLTTYLRARGQEWNFYGRFNLLYNSTIGNELEAEENTGQWLDRIFDKRLRSRFELTNKNARFKALGGDFYPEFTPLTLSNTEVRAILLTKEILLEEGLKGEEFIPVYEELADGKQGILNLASVYERAKSPRWFNKYDINIIFGRTDAAEEGIDEGGEDDRNGEFFESFYGTRLGIHPTDNSGLFFTYLHFKDDDNSIEVRKAATPDEDVVRSVDGYVSLFGDMLLLGGEMSWSHYTEDIEEGYDGIDDNAYRIFAQSKIRDLRLGLTHQRVDPDYVTQGNPYLQEDRDEWIGSVSYDFTDAISALFVYDTYEDNVDDRDEPTTRTDIYDLQWAFSFEKFPAFTLQYKVTRDLSDFVASTSIQKVDVRTSQKTARIGHTFGKTNISLNYSRVDRVDRSRYLSGLEADDYRTTLVSSNVSTSFFEKRVLNFSVYAFWSNNENRETGEDGIRYGGRANVEYRLIPRKLFVYGHYHYARDLNDGGHPIVTERKAGLKLEYFVTSSLALAAEYRRIMNIGVKDAEDFYKANIFGTRITYIF